MRLSRIRNLVFVGALGALVLRAVAQQPAPAETAEPPPPAPPATGDTNLFPAAPAPGAPVPDFSGTATAPASAFGTPDFSGSTGAAAPSLSGGAAKAGSAAGAGGPAPAVGTPAGGFVPGPFSSPASTTPTTPNGVAAPASVFGTTTLGSGTGLGAGAGTGTAGLGGANTRTPLPSTPTSFTLPGAYGQAPLTFSAGQGRLARPRYVWTGTAQFGYDDNVLQTPTAQRGLPAQKTLVQTQPEIPDQVIQVVIPPKGPFPIGIRPPPVIETRVIRGQPAQFQEVVVTPGVAPQEKIGSVVARTGVGFEMQLSNSRTVFTADAHVNFDYYFNRPGDQTDFNGNVAFIYAHRYSSRMQFSANVSAAYLSQPDLRVVSGPTRQVGDYLSYNSKFDLTYQWAKRFSTVTSLTLGLLNYMNAVQQLNDTYNVQIGTEARYSWSNRLTTVEEIRAQETVYPKGASRNSHSFFLLVGADYAYNRRLSGTARIGESIRTFEETGETKSSPYLELTAAYRFSQTGTISLSTRYGFEEPQDATSEVVVFRTSVSAVQAFTARLRGSLSLGYIHSSTTSNSAGGVSDITGDTFTADLGLDYALTRKFSLSASYSFVNDTSSLDEAGYYRNQLFLGAQYTF